jgi:predicted  nucleic acid-binding Zn-ribbon protein
VDQQVRGLRSRVDGSARRLAAQQTKLEQFQRQAGEVHLQLKQTKASLANFESDASGVEQRIEKHRQSMANVRSNKEYAALLIEVNTLKAEKAGIEDKSLEFMTRVEELEGRFAEFNTKVQEQQKIVDGASKDVAEGKAEIADQLGKLTAERDEAAAPIPPAALSQYTRLADDYEGEAMAEVEEQDRRRMEYTCGACFMSLPIQVVNASLSTKDKPVVCSNCGRILYVSQQLKEALVPK